MIDDIKCWPLLNFIVENFNKIFMKLKLQRDFVLCRSSFHPHFLKCHKAETNLKLLFEFPNFNS